NHHGLPNYKDMPGEPLFSFGFGLSYAGFEISDKKIIDDKLEFMIKNTSGMTAAAIPHLHVKRRNTGYVPRAKELVAFQKVTLQPGEEKQLFFDIENSVDYILEEGGTIY
ncbi:MAG: fibronectin type III-like domain-contianing protein, partial [Clostridia bacterium]|nr:fibronectin type III-like domain-contianing protein [Clostridia bacterium]